MLAVCAVAALALSVSQVPDAATEAPANVMAPAALAHENSALQKDKRFPVNCGHACRNKMERAKRQRAKMEAKLLQSGEAKGKKGSAGKIAGKLAGKLAGILTRKAKASERMKRQATSLYASKPTGLENPPVFHIDGVAQRLFLKRGEEVRAARSNRHLHKSVPHTPYVASPLCVPLRRRRC